MTIVWGKRFVRRVVDRSACICPICCTPTVCTSFSVNRVYHVYLVPLGKGTTVGYELECNACRTRWQADPSVPPVHRAVPPAPFQKIEELLDECQPGKLQALHAEMEALQQINDGSASDQARAAHLHRVMSIVESHQSLNHSMSVLSIVAATSAAILTVAAPISWYMYIDPTKRMSALVPIAFSAGFVLSIALTVFGLRQTRERNRAQAIARLVRSLSHISPTPSDLEFLVRLSHDASFKHCTPRSVNELVKLLGRSI